MLAAMKVIFLVALCQLALVKARTPPRASTKRPQTPHLPPTTNIPRTIRIFTNSPPTSTADPSSTDLCATANCSDVCDVINGKAVCSCNEKESKLDSDGLSCVTLSPCELAHCSDVCRVVKNKAVCSCSDDRFKLNNNGYTCIPKQCKPKKWWKKLTTKGDVDCGKGICSTQLDSKFSLQLPYCSCEVRGARYDSATKDCVRSKKYVTCDWPRKNDCDQKCTVITTMTGSSPKCECNKAGYSLKGDGKTCTVTDQCKVRRQNGGCEQSCKHLAPGKVQCSCGSRFTLDKKTGKKCLVKNCANGNTGCSHGCSQLDANDYYCYCPKGFRLNADMKTCRDVDECAGFHGCDQKCIDDGNHFYKCGCNEGFELQADGYSCRQEDKCLNSPCEQFCNSHDGSCYCDRHRVPDNRDPTKCVDRDECADGSAGCSELCENHDGGFSCKCFNPQAKLSNDLKTCYTDTCQTLTDITHGTTTCKKGDPSSPSVQVNDFCTFECKKGYRRDGKVRVKCTATGWDFIPPSCIDENECVRNPCNADETCANQEGSYLCLCNTGLTKVDGKCVDLQPPAMRNCPADQNVDLPDDAAVVSVSWKKPEFRDASGLVKLKENPDSSQKLGVGSYNIRYVAQDTTGNQASCEFKIKVNDKTPPMIHGCPNGRTFYLSPGRHPISSIANVTATDNSGKVTLTNDLHAAELTNIGVVTVNYYASDSSKNQATCSFTVNISVIECTQLRSPKNGYHGCDNWHLGTFCSPKCNDGYKFYEKPRERYHCGNNGKWTPAEAIPDCVPGLKPTRAELKFTAVYYTRKCQADYAQQTAFIKQYFTRNSQAFCYVDGCSLAEDDMFSCDDGKVTARMRTGEDVSQVDDKTSLIQSFIKKFKDAKLKNAAFMTLFFGLFDAAAPETTSYGTPIDVGLDLTCPAGSSQINYDCVSCPQGNC